MMPVRCCLLLTLMLTVSSATDIYVSPSGNDGNVGNINSPFRTLQRAVLAASSGDSIYLLPGSYTESITVLISGQTLSIFSASCEEDAVITVPSSGTSIFLISANAAVTLGNVVLQGGGASSSCISLSSSSLTLAGTVIRDCSSLMNGGAIQTNSFISNVLIVEGCSFVNNSAPNDGGAIYMSSGNLYILNSTFSNNSAGINGGALYITGGTANVSYSIFVNNSGANAGAFYNNNPGVAFFTGNYFASNTARNGGGGAGVAEFNAQTTLIGNTYELNAASDHGGAITNSGISTVSTNECYFNNFCPRGGAVFVFTETITITGGFFANNKATDGAAVYLQPGSGPPTASIQNCEFYNNSATGLGSLFYLNSGTYLTANNCTIECNSQTDIHDSGGGFSSSFLNLTNCTDSSLTAGHCPSPDLISGRSDSIVCIPHLPTTSSTPTSTSTATSTSMPISTSTSTSKSTVPSGTSTSSFMANCTVSCPTVVVIDQRVSDNSNSTIQWQVVENTTNVELTVTTADNSSQSYQVGWGAIREITTQGKVVKVLDPVSENWPRIIETNETTVTIIYSVAEDKSPWQRQPIKIELWTILSMPSNSSTPVTSAKFSLSIDGDWQFEQASNKLQVDFTVQAAFREIASCGRSNKYQQESTTDETVFHFGSVQSSAVELSIQRGCVADGVARSSSASSPVFFNNNSAVNVTIQFPSFSSSLSFDPNFGLLLGYSTNACNSLLEWILPASFLAGAAVIILLVVILSYVPGVRYIVLGKEGSRVHNLRQFVSKNNITLDANLEDPAFSSI